MIRLVVRLLGDLQVGRGAAGPAVPIPARKARALLAYLALRPGRAHPRDRLTTLLWPDVSDAQARQSLRQALAGLRRALPNGAFVISADTVAVEPSRVDVDVVRFEQLVADGSRARLEQAVALYRGDLLARTIHECTRRSAKRSSECEAATFQAELAEPRSDRANATRTAGLEA